MNPPAASAPAVPDVAVVRLPIADDRRGVIGYELLFGGLQAQPADSRTTSALLMDVFATIGLERLTGEAPAWISMPREFLLEVGTPPLRPDRAVVQVPAGQTDAELLDVLQRLSSTGYSVVVDDYRGDPRDSRLLLVSSTVKISIKGRSDADLIGLLYEPQSMRQQLVATHVDSFDDFDRCQALGFTAFQGRFFAQPRAVRARRSATAGIGSLRQLSQLSAGEVSFEDLEAIVASDVGLSLKLLRYVNSAFFALPRTIGSVREAMAMLGARTVRRWALVIAMSSIPDVPSELISLALQRARMCEMLSGAESVEERESYFTVGLFSVADALLDMPMEEVLQDLPFADDVAAALLRLDGPKGELLGAVVAYELGEFPEAPVAADGLTLASAYRDAIEWTAESARAVAA